MDKNEVGGNTSHLDLVISGAPYVDIRGMLVTRRIVCADGFSLSVQASWAHYCLDADGRRPSGIDGDPADRNSGSSMPYTAVEVGFPSERPEPWHCTARQDGWDSNNDHGPCDGWESYAERDNDPTDTVYGFVPVQMVRDLIASHGGEATDPERSNR